MRAQFSFLLLCALVAAFTLVHAQDATTLDRDYWPTDGWRTSTPAEQDMAGDLLAHITTSIAEEDMTYVRAVLVVRHGYLVFEEYYNGFAAPMRDNVRSVTKSVTSALVGIALANGDIESLDVRVADYFPEYVADDDKRDLTLRNLLMMRSGLKWGEANWQVIPLWESDLDQMRRILNLPLENAPGEVWNYSTADAHLIGGILTRAAGMSLLEYSNAHLFGPLGISGAEWDTDSQGYNVGGAGLSLTPREMATFGYLYLNDGLWDGEQIVPADWVTLTTTAQDEETDYGYLWWRGERDFFGGYPAFAALGYGGDMIFVYPELDLVVVAKTSYFVTATAAERQEEAVMGLVRDFVIPAVRDAALLQTAESFIVFIFLEQPLLRTNIVSLTQPVLNFLIQLFQTIHAESVGDEVRRIGFDFEEARMVVSPGQGNGALQEGFARLAPAEAHTHLKGNARFLRVDGDWPAGARHRFVLLIHLKNVGLAAFEEGLQAKLVAGMPRIAGDERFTALWTLPEGLGLRSHAGYSLL